MPGIVDYGSIVKQAAACSIETLVAYLMEELPYVWRDAYIEMAGRGTNIVRIQRGSFEYIYDDYASLEETGAVQHHAQAEARLVAVLGRSQPSERPRDDGRLRGWVGGTEKVFGQSWDKGHFIAHCIGGAADGSELNIFAQRRELNRGWSDAGRRFRQMERYCVDNPGTFCFDRPLYIDQSAHAAFMEVGVLKSEGGIWVERFDNR